MRCLQTTDGRERHSLSRKRSWLVCAHLIVGQHHLAPHTRRRGGALWPSGSHLHSLSRLFLSVGLASTGGRACAGWPRQSGAFAATDSATAVATRERLIASARWADACVPNLPSADPDVGHRCSDWSGFGGTSDVPARWRVCEAEEVCAAFSSPAHSFPAGI